MALVVQIGHQHFVDGAPAQGWPWLFEAEVSYEVRGGEFGTEVLITHRAGGSCADPMPVGIGFHPFWNRSPRGEVDDVRLKLGELKWYPCKGMIPIKKPASRDPHVLRMETSLGTVAMDDVFLGSADGAVIEWPRA